MVTATRHALLLPYSEALSDLAELIRPAVVAVRDGRRGSGSGVVWAPNTIITNHHVVQGETPEIIFIDGRKAAGKVIARDPRNDIVALQVDGTPEPAAIGDSLELRVGQLVLAMGHPLGVENAVTAGIISALPTARDPRALIRSDLHLNPGNSGGPLFDANGEVIGINSMVAGPGTALSVPSNTVQALLATVQADPPFKLPANGGFNLTCTWNNMSDATVKFGESVNSEMCFFWAYYYPSQGGAKVCIHTDKYGPSVNACCPDSSQPVCSAIASQF